MRGPVRVRDQPQGETKHSVSEGWRNLMGSGFISSCRNYAMVADKRVNWIPVRIAEVQKARLLLFHLGVFRLFFLSPHDAGDAAAVRCRRVEFFPNSVGRDFTNLTLDEPHHHHVLCWDAALNITTQQKEVHCRSLSSLEHTLQDHQQGLSKHTFDSPMAMQRRWQPIIKAWWQHLRVTRHRMEKESERGSYL